MSSSVSLKEKEQALNNLLHHEFVMVHVDPSQKGVVLPPHLMSQSTVTLQISHAFRTELYLDAEKFEQELLFKGRYFPCSVPLEAVWGATDPEGQSTIWPGCAPEEVLDKIKAQEQQTKSDPSDAKPERPAKKGKPHLRLVK